MLTGFEPVKIQNAKILTAPLNKRREYLKNENFSVNPI